MGCIMSTSRENVETNDVQQRPQNYRQAHPRVVEEEYVENGHYTVQYYLDITDNFADGRKIGRGGFGVVYKGILPDGGIVAVKRIMNTLSTHDDSAQFRNEVKNLKGLEHTNIVRLMDYCQGTHDVLRRGDGRPVYREVEERLLCFEYLTNGSLDTFLSNQSRGFDWGMHFEIIKGISSGLSYLHEERENGPIIHLDLKPANILLDDKMVPKIADFGLSRLFGIDQTRTVTRNVMGTQGYIAREYLQGVISAKADVFSLGVVILEIVTGQANHRENTESSLENYITKVRQKWTTFAQVVSRYPSLEPECLKEVTGCIEIGITCVDINPERRPTAGQINYMLSKAPQLKDGQIFIVDETSRKIGYLLSGRALSVAWPNDTCDWSWHSIQGSRFVECPVLQKVRSFEVTGEIPTRDLFADTTYAAYLVYRLKNEAIGFRSNLQKSSIRLPGDRPLRRVCLDPADPAGDRLLDVDVTYPVERSDGWLEIKLGEFVNSNELQEEEAVIANVYVRRLLETSDEIWMGGLIIEGMEFRPKS